MKQTVATILLLALLLGGNASYAERESMAGILRNVNDFSVFWPCRYSLPHYAHIQPAAKNEIDNLLRDKPMIFIRVEAEVTNEKTRSQDGTVYIYQVLGSGKDVEC